MLFDVCPFYTTPPESQTKEKKNVLRTRNRIKQNKAKKNLAFTHDTLFLTAAASKKERTIERTNERRKKKQQQQQQQRPLSINMIWTTRG